MPKNNILKIAVLPGDGIGEEVTNAAIPVFQQLNIPTELRFGKIGWECWKSCGEPVPSETWELIKQTDACLLGAITSKPLSEALEELPKHLQGENIKYVSPVIQLRQNLNLFANVRPIFSVLDNKNFNFVVIRENTEGLYAGLDYRNIPDGIKASIQTQPQWKNLDLNNASCTIRLQTNSGLTRIFEYAFSYARKYGFKKVTFADKPNVMRESGHFAKVIFEKIALRYTDIESEILNVDAVGLWIVRRPENFGVIVAENMFGDILSDVGGGVMGGLGFAPSANIGLDYSYFEPVHGSAPRYAGKNKANPSAMFLSIRLLLEQFGYSKESILIKEAVKIVVQENKFITYDIGGNASTNDMASAILEKIANPIAKKTVSFIATGDELVKGEILDTNSQYFAKTLTDLGINVKSQQLVIDEQIVIEKTIANQLAQNDCIVLCGGLGPTSDDRTRFALANVMKQKLLFNQSQWDYICDRLKGFGIAVHESNKQQVLFPENSEILHNPNGTAAGCKLQINNKIIFMLPGPPKECIPMFDKYVIPSLIEKCFINNKQQLYWKLIGVIEADFAAKIDELLRGYLVFTSYRWNYPYLDLKVLHNISDADNVAQISNLIHGEIKNNLVATKNISSLELLKEYLSKYSYNVCIEDNLTKGEFRNLFGEHKQLYYHKDMRMDIDNTIFVTSLGLEKFHDGKPFVGTTNLDCTLTIKEIKLHQTVTIAYRGSEVIDYGVHFMGYCICKMFEKIGFYHG